MKALIETTGSFMLQDPILSSETIRHDRPTLVLNTAFFQGRVAAGQAKSHLTDVPVEFTDEQWHEIFKTAKEDTAKALKAFAKLIEPAPAVKDSKEG